MSLSTTSLFGQKNSSVVINGKVSDSTGNPISFASVTIFNEATGSGKLFTQTDDTGNYSLSITDTNILREPIGLRVSAIGYIKQIKKINRFGSYDFILNKDIRVLKEITIKDNRPHINVKGDTLSYRATDFSNKNDRVIGDVIKKLPGIEVSGNGLIKYNGKPINNFYIEGDNLLDDKYNIASNTILADVVDKIQVIENNQNIKMLNGIVPTDRAAINITLKKKNKLTLINTAKAGVGIKNLYTGELNSMAFKIKFKAINSIKINNIGKDLRQEVQSLNLLDFLNSSDDQTTELLNLSGTTTSGLAADRILFNNAGLFNINDLFKIKKDFSFRINAYFLKDKQMSSYKSNTKYFLPGNDTISFIENENNKYKINDFHAQLNFNKNSTSKYINNSLTLDRNTGVNEVNTIANGENIKQQLASPFLHLTNNLNGIILLHRKNILEYYSYASYHKNPQTYNVVPGVLEEVLNNNIPFKQSVQQSNLPAFFTNNYISWHKVSDHFFQNYKLGVSYQAQTLSSEIKVQQFDDSINVLSDTFSNHLTWHQLKWHAEPELRWQKDKNSIGISMPVNFINLSYKETGLQKYFNRNYFFMNPYLKWIYKVDQESNIFLSYNFNNSLGSIDQIYYGIIMKDYRSISSNDGTMQQSYNNSIGAGLNFKRSLKIFFFNLYTNYGINQRNFINTSVLKNDLTQSVSIPYDNNSRFYTINWNMSKYIFKLKTTLTLKYFFRYNYSKEIQNYLIFPVVNLSNSYFLGIRPNVASWLNINYNIDYNTYKAQSKSENENSSTRISQLKQHIDLDIFPSDQFALKIAGEYYQNQNTNGEKASLYFADASIKYQFRTKPFDIELMFSNITNTSNYYNLSVSQNQVSSSSYALRKRSILLSASYNF